MAGLDFGNAPAGETDDDHAATPGDRAHARVEHVAADVVDHDINTAFAHRGEHLLAQFLAQVRDARIDDVIGAGRFRRRGLVVTADGGEHHRAQRFGHLYGRHPHAARGARHQHDFARLQLRAFDQREVRGVVSKPHRRRLGKADRDR